MLSKMGMAETLALLNNSLAAPGLGFLTVKSRALRGRADVTFFVSPSTAGRQDVPLILLLHGAYGSHWNWALLGRAHLTAQSLIDTGILPPCVLAMPSDGLWGDGSGYLTHATHDFERWIAEEVPAAARGAAACLSPQSPLFLCGLSMGGFGALRIGAKFPALFAGLSAHSAITQFEQLLRYVDEKAEQFGLKPEDVSVLDAMLRNRAVLPPFRFDCGAKDPLMRPNRQLHEDLLAHGIAHEFAEFPGAHDWVYWTARLVDSLQFFGKILKSNKLS
jgi:putative tributyrin esterase